MRGIVEWREENAREGKFILARNTSKFAGAFFENIRIPTQIIPKNLLQRLFNLQILQIVFFRCSSNDK